MSETDLDRRIAAERKDAARSALLNAIKEIDKLSGNAIYVRAWKKVHGVLRKLADEQAR